MKTLLVSLVVLICICSLHARPKFENKDRKLAKLEKKLMRGVPRRLDLSPGQPSRKPQMVRPPMDHMEEPPMDHMEEPPMNSTSKSGSESKENESPDESASNSRSKESDEEPDIEDDMIVNDLDQIMRWIQVEVKGKMEKIPTYMNMVRMPDDKEMATKFGTEEEMGAMENIFSENSDKMDKISDRLVQGDVIMPKNKDENERRYKRNSIRDTRLLWPNAQMPYYIDPSFDSAARQRIIAGIQQYHENTCIRLVQRTNQRDYIHIVPRSGCYSTVGRSGGRQELSLGGTCTYSRGTIMHELMHAAGFHHEQTRTDRDSFVTIYYQNIQSGLEYNFQKYDASYIDPLGTRYDYASIMHYPRNAFSVNGRDTIVPRQSGVSIGNRVSFSQTDAYKLNTLYNCGKVGQAQALVCEDNNENNYCAYWQGEGYCSQSSQYYEYMSENCPRSCNLCTETEPTEAPDCGDDNNENCTYWQGQGYCSQSSEYYEYMSENC